MPASPHGTENQRRSPAVFPPPPGPVFLVGIGGIGMSGLAQFLAWRGYRVAGSDRDLAGPGRTSLYRALARLGVRVYPQDGCGPRAVRPAALVRSAAIEPGNPDIEAAPSVPVFGRAETLATLLNRTPGRQIAIAGSAGKTTVTAWTSSALRALGEPVLAVCGGFVPEYAGEGAPGNFLADPGPRWLVYEADESDGSLVRYTPHIGAVLNLGRDHMEASQLLDLFRRFAEQCRCCRVVHAELAGVLFPDRTDPPPSAAARRPECEPGTPRRVVFCAAPGAESAAAGPGELALSAPEAVATGPDGVRFRISGLGRFHIPALFGEHSAWNASAVAAILRAAFGSRLPPDRIREALAGFRGVVRRFQRVGSLRDGTPVIDDYGHNVEKIRAALRTAQSLSPQGILVFFQPHGFGPLGFMRAALTAMLRETLRPADRFVFLPVYYAGGTTSFSPSAEEVAAEAAASGAPVLFCADRNQAEGMLRVPGHSWGLVLVLGARDPSLGDWARSLCRSPERE